MLDEIDSRFLSAANFFIQDGQFERCLACIRDLHLICNQKKTCTSKILGLSEESAELLMANQLETAQEVISVGYGYNIVSHDSWANILFRQVVHRGKKEVLTAYRGQVVSFPPQVKRRLMELWRGDAAAQKDSGKRQLWQWVEEELARFSGGGARP